MKAVRLGALALLALLLMAAQARTGWPRIAASKDGVPISYEVYGSGEPTLVFVHGWSCDSRYWREQVPALSAKRRVVVLIGHSMGGAVIAEAARLMPGRVLGLIGVDTLENVEYPMTREEMRKMISPLKKDFRAGCRKFVEGMLYPKTDPRLREWILADMAAAPPAVALSALEEGMSQYVTGDAAKVFDKVRVPVVVVNGDLWPVNYEANRRHMASFEAIVIPGADHFLMMSRPEEFNRALENAVRMLPGE